MTVLCANVLDLPGDVRDHLVWASSFPDYSSCTSAFSGLPYVLVSGSDYKALTDLSTLFSLYFAFDPVLFESVMEWSLLSFVTGHCLGRLLQVWRKSF